MERRYLTVFIAILVVSLFVGIVWNAVLDISSHSQAKKAIRTTFELVKANKAEEFVEQTRLAYSMIYRDYGEKRLTQRIESAVDLYTVFSDMSELKSVSLTKVLERIACLAAVTFTDAQGKEVTHHMLFVKYEGRSGKKESAWVPFRILTIEEQRNEMLEQLRKAVDVEAVRKRAREQAQKALEAPAAQVDALISQILDKVTLADKTRNQLVDALKTTKGLVEVPELMEKFGAEEAVDMALRKTGVLVEKLGAISNKVESGEVARTIKKLPELAKKLPTLEELVKEIEKRAKSPEAEEEKKEEKSTEEKAKGEMEKRKETRKKLVKEFRELPVKIRSAQLRSEIEEALRLMDEGGKELEGRLKAVATKVESPKLACQIEKLEQMAYKNTEELPGALDAIASMLKSDKLAGRLKENKELLEQVREAKKLAQEEALNPLSAFKAIETPKAKYLRLVARLKEIGSAEDPEKKMAEVLQVVSRISSGLAQSEALWVKLKTPYVWRYAQAAKKLGEIALSEELKEKANKLAEAAAAVPKEQAENPELPDLADLAGRVKEELLGKSTSASEKLEALAKLGRSELQSAEAKEAFMAAVMQAAKQKIPNYEELFAGFAEACSTMPFILRLSVANMVPALISNKATKTYWEDFFKAELLKEKSTLSLEEIVESISRDALDGSDLYEARVKALGNAVHVERNRRGSVEAGVRKRTEELAGTFPAKWAAMESREDYMKWAFPGGKPTPQDSGLSESQIRKLVKYQEKFAGIVAGKKVAVDITHHWYPDPEDGFQKTDTRRMSEIVRARFQTNPGAEKGSEEYTTNDFMLLQEMAPDWSVKWKLYRVCNLYEYDKCWEIVERELEKRKAYFADGKTR